MRKMMLAMLLMCIVALVSTLPISVHATPSTTASGTWQYLPSITSTRLAGRNLFIEATSVDVWTGTIGGEGGSVETVVIHKFVSWFEPTGFWYAEGILTLDPCTVADKSGTLIIRYVGKGTPEGQWSGRWVILGGTGDLAYLCGQGTWWGPDGNGLFPYLGQIRFESD